MQWRRYSRGPSRSKHLESLKELSEDPLVEAHEKDPLKEPMIEILEEEQIKKNSMEEPSI